ncbi:hypothetical protein CBM2626_A40321 [Cupriavidus taiwanensis]|nr:hypothetical protein CBM2626_A40321 [Cupriavidus taiwanensis]
MTSSSIYWSSVSKDMLSKVLLGGPTKLSNLSVLPTPNLRAPDGDIAIGYIEAGTTSVIPALALVDERNAEDLFAWLATYSPEVFPISQYVRVLGAGEWELTGSVTPSTRLDADPFWPSLILGELLAQGSGHDLRLTSIPLSRVPLCFSFTQARASMLFRSAPEALQAAANRLATLEKADRKWRVIGTDSLRSAWALAEDAFKPDEFVTKLVRALSDTFERQREPRQAAVPLPEELQEISLNLRKLAFGPLEYRVEEFERAAAALFSHSERNEASRLKFPALIAALTIWVGSGTSHISLLSEFAQRNPFVYVWFGAFAGVLGHAAWHPDWGRTTTAIGKSLRSGFDLASPPTADLSWNEFEWLKGLGSFELLSGVPRASAKILTVDVLPGASAPFRLAADDVSTHGGLEGQRLEPVMAKSIDGASAVHAPASEASVQNSVHLANSSEGVLISVDDYHQLSNAARAMSRILEQARSQTADASPEPFALQPSPGRSAKRTTPPSRKTVRKSSTKKLGTT